jgi:transcriptional regulator with XRE-family HTH domain
MLSRVVAGKAMPSFSLALRIAKAANIPVESLAPAVDDIRRSQVVGL